MAMEIVNTVVGKVVDYLFTAVGNQLGYLVQYNDHVRNLRKRTDKLKGARQRVQERIDEAEKRDERIKSDILKWLADADAIILEAESFLEDKANATKSWCVRLSSRYSYSKEARNKTRSITELQEECKNFETVSRPAPLPGIQSSSSINIDAFQSQKSAMRGIMEALNDKHVQIIGVCGMVGAGKTAVVTEVGKRVKESKLFHEVAMAEVSQTVDVAKIQDTIAHMLGTDLPRTDISERARSLWARLSSHNKKTLVILDDVWSWLDLGAIGIPSGENCVSCKVLITSRSRDVCNQMKAQKFIEVGLLSDQEAWVIFREVVGEAVDTYDLKPIAQEIVYECGRLPLAILAVGRDLRNKNKEAWKHAALLLRRSPPYINPMLRQVFPKLELSYTFLEDKEAQSFFLLFCLFPEDSDVPIESLVRYGLGLRLFQDVYSVEEARARVHAVVSTLKASYLLLDGKDKCHAKMHDVVRDVAITIASKGENIFLVKAGIGLREWPERDTFDKYTAISLMSNRISTLPDGLACKNLQALLLQHNPMHTIPGSFFEEMRELKVIDLSREQWGVPMALPLSFTLLTNLRTLCIDGLQSPDISVIGQLKKLEILSLARSYIVEIPQAIGELTNLRLLDMSAVRCQTEIVPGVISSLCKLEELYTDYNSVTWMKADSEKRILIELKSLTRLTCLNIKLLNTRGVPDDLYIPELSRYFVNIGGVDWTPEIDCLKTLIIYKMQPRFPGWILELSKRAEGLYVSNCSSMKNLFNDLNSAGLNYVKDLSLYDCKGIRHIVDTTELALQLVFCSLEKICIRYLGDLVELCHGQLPGNSFSNIKRIQISNCSNSEMEKFVGCNLLTKLSNLQTFVGESCGVSCVFDLEDIVTGEGGKKVLSNLEDLQLVYLRGLVDIWKGSHRCISLTNLVKVNIDLCPRLKRLFSPTLVDGLVNLETLELDRCYDLEAVFDTCAEDKETGAWENAQGKIFCLQRLRVVRVKSCRNLRNIFPHSLAFNLAQLRHLEVAECLSMEEIVGAGDQEGQQEADPVKYPSLELFKFKGCPKLKTFGHGLQLTPKLRKVQDVVVLIGNINATVQQIYEYEQSLSQDGNNQPAKETLSQDDNQPARDSLSQDGNQPARDSSL